MGPLERFRAIKKQVGFLSSSFCGCARNRNRRANRDNGNAMSLRCPHDNELQFFKTTCSIRFEGNVGVRHTDMDVAHFGHQHLALSHWHRHSRFHMVHSARGRHGSLACLDLETWVSQHRGSPMSTFPAEMHIAGQRWQLEAALGSRKGPDYSSQRAWGCEA